MVEYSVLRWKDNAYREIRRIPESDIVVYIKSRFRRDRVVCNPPYRNPLDEYNPANENPLRMDYWSYDVYDTAETYIEYKIVPAVPDNSNKNI